MKTAGHAPSGALGKLTAVDRELTTAGFFTEEQEKKAPFNKGKK